MYYYAEYLRGTRALGVIGIILGIALVLAIVFRLWALGEHSPQVVANALQSSPTAHVTNTTLADGTLRTVIADPVKHVHAVIERRGSVFHMDATMPSADAPSHNNFSMAISSIDENQKSGMSHFVVTFDHSFDLGVGILFAISCVIGLITATMLGGALAKENDGHLEIAWTKPVSRERLALASMAADMATIVVSQLAMVVVELVVIVMYVVPHLYVNAMTGPVIALAILGPIAWYACLTAFSASLKRGLGMVCGLGWLAALAIPGLAAATQSSVSDIGRTLHTVFKGLSYIDPIAYISFRGTVTSSGLDMRTFVGGIGASAAALAILTAVYVTLAVLQWRRVEA